MKHKIFLILKITFFIIACSLLYLGINSLIVSSKLKNELDGYQRHELACLDIDFSKPGTYTTELDHISSIPDFITFIIKSDSDEQTKKELLYSLYQTETVIKISDSNENICERKYLEGDGSAPDIVFFAIPFSHIPEGKYKLSISFQKPLSETSSELIKETIVCRYRFCGMEYLGAGLIGGYGLIFTSISIIIFLVIIMLVIRNRIKKNKINKSTII
jgi:hypothetical protein